MPERHRSKTIFYAILACSLFLLGGGLVVYRVASSPSTVPQERYYQAVYVLRNLCESAAEEPEEIPQSIRFADNCESLIHHPDKIFVLTHIADELAALKSDVPKAALYEAYARMALGERAHGTNLLMRYVIENEYAARHYALLCEHLYVLEDYTSLLLMAREWGERDASCREDRAKYLWTALYNLGRYSDAAKAVEADHDCLGWMAAVFSAKTFLALGKDKKAELILKEASSLSEEDAARIRRVWEQIKALPKV